MNITIKSLQVKTAHGYLSAQSASPGGAVRWQYRDVAGAWETFDLTFDLEGFEFPPCPPVPPPPSTWPPTAPPWPPQPVDIATTDPALVLERVQWWLWHTNSNDDQSYWMDAIVLKPEPGHTPGWTADSYWSDKIAAGDGVGKGYVWPPK